MEKQSVNLISVNHWYPSRDLSAYAWCCLSLGILLAAAAPVIDERGFLMAGWITRMIGWGLFVSFFFRLILNSGESPTDFHLPFEASSLSLLCKGKDRELRQIMATPPLVKPVDFLRGLHGASKILFWGLLLAGRPLLRYAGLSHATSLVVCLALILFLLTVHLRPEYYRVVPGKVQILRGSFFSSVVQIRKEIELHGAEIVCRLDKRKLTVSARAKKHVFNLIELWEPHVFAAAVISAARFPNAPTEPDRIALVG